ncbi:ketopantoate reductase PanE/ApbA C terminal-domain-containing protein [Penicillium angulare]|uniref:ketopantoate reductase PanE/ApbA C terminal-domain-containing protein n=1 Tax=Penicillium angulare TaxID=116970 RepID=UPI0025409AA8|nr:ketopantoate reductase PanE/ApbA C terminal-domain-containing protein [Penicillium angulare]KAJ5273091.1 ketopantoate reductase PanE/ApbA C terminal-domain-containing protein [Penicillium angulare]
MTKSRVLLVGTGGIGTVSAYHLEKGGLAEVTAVMRSNYEAAMKNGIDIDSVQFGQIKAWKPTAITKSVPDVSKEDTQPFDYILVTTKSIPDAPPTVADIIAPAVTPGKTANVLSQNGINIEKPLITRDLPDDDDCQKIGAFFSPQVPTEAAEAAAKQYVQIYNPDGKLDVIYAPEIDKIRWRKIAYNASMNPVATILRMDVPRIKMSKHIVDDLIVPIVLEIRAVAEAKGVTLQPDLIHAVTHQDPNDTAFKPSMCQDYEKGNLMEIENIVSEPLREAEKLNIPTPTLKTVYGITKGLQLKVKEEKGLWGPKFEPGNPYE